MQERRKPQSEVTPAYEDRGIFRGAIVNLTVQVVPVYALNTRQDLMVKAYVSDGGAIDVVFPGRRRRHANALLNRIKMLWTKAQREGRAGDPNRIRFPITIEGAWRPRFKRDDQGWETRELQLFAARWAMLDVDGNSVTYGEPVVR